MRCPQNPEYWQQYSEAGDPAAAQHLKYCAACREEAANAARLPHVLAQMPTLDAPKIVVERFQALAEATAGLQLTCDDVLMLMEAWREGDLDAQRSFLMEDHLLWCESCADALAQADALTTALRNMPVLMPPPEIAERIAAARIPWWQRMLQPVQPIWGRLAPAALGVFATVTIVAALMMRGPAVNNIAQLPKEPGRIPPPKYQVGEILGPAIPRDTHGKTSVVTPNSGQPGHQFTVIEGLKDNLFGQPTVVPPKKDKTTGPSKIDNGVQEKKLPPLTNEYRTTPSPAPGGSPALDANSHVVPDLDQPVSTGSYSAREAVLSMARDEELAASEESNATAPEVKKFASLPIPSRPEITPKPAVTIDLPGTPEPDDRALLRKQLSDGSRNAAIVPKSMSLRASHDGSHADGQALWLTSR